MSDSEYPCHKCGEQGKYCDDAQKKNCCDFCKWFYDGQSPCNFCKRVQTNEEWICDYFNTTFRAMSTREKAEVIADFIQRLEELNGNYLAWYRWLKEVHQ